MLDRGTSNPEGAECAPIPRTRRISVHARTGGLAWGRPVLNERVGLLSVVGTRAAMCIRKALRVEYPDLVGGRGPARLCGARAWDTSGCVARSSDTWTKRQQRAVKCSIPNRKHTA